MIGEERISWRAWLVSLAESTPLRSLTRASDLYRLFAALNHQRSETSGEIILAAKSREFRVDEREWKEIYESFRREILLLSFQSR